MNKKGMIPVATLHVVPMRTPSDTSEIEKLFASGELDPHEIVAVVGKTEGNGLPNDYGRAFGDYSIRSLLATYRDSTPNQIADEVTLAISGGSPGTVAPHATILSQRWIPEEEVAAEQPTGGLVLGRSHTSPIYPQDIGRLNQVEATTKAVLEAIEDAGIEDLSQIHMVLVKGPALSADSIASLLEKGIEPVTRDPGIGPMGSMCYSNDAMAIGVGIAMGEIDRDKVTDATIRNDWSLYSKVAATSSGGEKLKGEVLVIANSPKSHSRFRAGHGITTSVGSSDGLKEALRSAGLVFDCCPSEDDRSMIAQVFGKFTLPGSAQLNGARITLLDDHEAHHIAKTIGGATVTSVTGLTMAFISGGEANSHMGPPNGNPICAVVRI